MELGGLSRNRLLGRAVANVSHAFDRRVAGREERGGAQLKLAQRVVPGTVGRRLRGGRNVASKRAKRQVTCRCLSNVCDRALSSDTLP